MKPIHKWNDGQGATLCHQCNCTISLGHTEDLYCKKCNDHRKELLIELMRLDESIGLYVEQAKNEEPKQRLEKYSERFDNDKSPIGNPDTWGKRIVEEPKQETLEEAAEKVYISHKNNDLLYGHSEELQLAYKAGIVDGAKWQQEQDKNKFSEEEVLELLLNLPNYFISTQKDQRINEWFEQFKNK